ncbi:MAG: flagellar biosynthetic protein FliO [Planctomycetota bacterium]
MARSFLPFCFAFAVLFLPAVAAHGAQAESLPLGVPAAEQTPLGSQPLGAGGSIGSTVASLAAVIALVVACLTGYRYLATRAGGLAGQAASVGAPAGILDLLGRYQLGRGQSLLLLKIDRRILLVSQASGTKVGAPPTMSTLCEITDHESVSSILAKASASGEPAFKDVIATLERQDPSGGAPARPDDIEVVDLTRPANPLAPFARLAGFGRKRA